MSSERWQQVDRIFVDALQRAPGVRVAFVIEERAMMRRCAEVLSLLSASDASAEFMAASAFERLAGAVATHGWTLEACHFRAARDAIYIVRTPDLKTISGAAKRMDLYSCGLLGGALVQGLRR
jgi:hypothetical protein